MLMVEQLSLSFYLRVIGFGRCQGDWANSILQGLNRHNERLGKVRLFGKCNAKKKKIIYEKSMSGQSDQLI